MSTTITAGIKKLKMANHLGETGDSLSLRQLGVKAVAKQPCTNPLFPSVLQKNIVAKMICFWNRRKDTAKP
jgi:hypothetical protein